MFSYQQQSDTSMERGLEIAPSALEQPRRRMWVVAAAVEAVTTAVPERVVKTGSQPKVRNITGLKPATIAPISAQPSQPVQGPSAQSLRVAAATEAVFTAHATISDTPKIDQTAELITVDADPTDAIESAQHESYIDKLHDDEAVKPVAQSISLEATNTTPVEIDMQKMAEEARKLVQQIRAA